MLFRVHARLLVPPEHSECSTCANPCPRIRADTTKRLSRRMTANSVQEAISKAYCELLDRTLNKPGTKILVDDCIDCTTN
jgi:hypothetical protein